MKTYKREALTVGQTGSAGFSKNSQFCTYSELARRKKNLILMIKTVDKKNLQDEFFFETESSLLLFLSVYKEVCSRGQLIKSPAHL